MKKTLSSIALSLAFVFASFMAAEGRSLQEIQKTQELRVCISPIHPSVCSVEPEDCRDECRISGPAYEAAKAFAAFLGDGISPRFLRVGWDEQFFDKNGAVDRDGSYTPELLASGRCDFYPSNLAKSEWRSKKIDFVTLFPNRRMLVVNRSARDKFKSIADLAGKTAAVERDTSYHTWLQEKNQSVFRSNPVHIELMPTDECLRAVDGGKADFTMVDSDAAIWAVKNELHNSDMAFPVGPTDEIGWGFRKEDKDLQEVVRTFFEHQRSEPDSALNAIWRKYYGMNLTQFIDLVSSLPE
ncbi:MAG: transporter substrate-binding domain-containing protein [Syntrophobacteraceae bacterium]